MVFISDVSTSASNIRRRSNVLICRKQKALMINALLRLRMLLALVLVLASLVKTRLKNVTQEADQLVISTKRGRGVERGTRLRLPRTHPARDRLNN